MVLKLLWMKKAERKLISIRWPNNKRVEIIFANLAELLPEDVLGRIGSDLNENYMQYKTSRKEWEDTYIKGLDLLGFKYVNPTQPFQGASGATHPVLAEAVTQFQAQAYKELLPAMGPVRTQVLGAPNRQKEEQSNRVKNFMNYQTHGCYERVRTRVRSNALLSTVGRFSFQKSLLR